MGNKKKDHKGKSSSTSSFCPRCLRSGFSISELHASHCRCGGTIYMASEKDIKRACQELVERVSHTWPKR